MSGHLFVVHGDLTRLACDALVIPCDGSGDVSRAWESLLPPDRVSEGENGWLRVSGFEGPHSTLPQVEGRAVHLVDTVDGAVDEDAVVDRAVEAVRRASKGLHRRTPRELPLVGLPLVGTGAGGLASRRGAVVRRLVDRLTNEAATTGLDVALMGRDPRDFAAIQQARVPHAWRELDAELLSVADQLGAKAARNELSLFLGAGLSIPAGLPLWGDLLKELASVAGLSEPRLESGDDYLRAADEIKASLDPEVYRALMVRIFRVGRYALGHGLLAGLTVQRAVTTNYDPCMELALESVVGPDGFRVLTRHLAGGGLPWLLKLHGDISRPETLILSKSDYDRYLDDGRALYGTVQGLMLTSHLLFVGFSLVDRNFLALAEAVSRVRREAEMAPSGDALVAGTAIALRVGDLDVAHWEDDLEIVTMSRGVPVEAAARRLEIFLDRLAWRADRERETSAQYLLDARYDEQFTDEADTTLRSALRMLVDRLPPEVGRSSGWRVVHRALADLGADETWLARFATPTERPDTDFDSWDGGALAREGDQP